MKTEDQPVLKRHHRMNDVYAGFQEDVVALATAVCGEDASEWSTQLHVMQKMQSSHVWELWVRSGLTREQFVQFVHRLRIKKMKGDLTLRKLSPQHFAPALAFAVPSGWRVSYFEKCPYDYAVGLHFSMPSLTLRSAGDVCNIACRCFQHHLLKGSQKTVEWLPTGSQVDLLFVFLLGYPHVMKIMIFFMIMG
jgi:hypothetical protein